MLRPYFLSPVFQRRHRTLCMLTIKAHLYSAVCYADHAAMTEPFMPSTNDASQQDTPRPAAQPNQASPSAGSPAPLFRDYVQGDLT